MQIFEIWNNLFTKVLQIHSSFLSLLYFVNFEKSKFDAHLYKFDEI
jgi:hypothetical protein